MKTTLDKAELQSVADRLSEPCEYIPTPGETGIDPGELAEAVRMFRSAVFAGYYGSAPLPQSLAGLHDLLARQAARACRTFRREADDCAEVYGGRIAAGFVGRIPELRRLLASDVKAVFDGDPAAGSYEEVILCYPAIVAMVHYRFAHALHEMGVPIVPRIITELAHSATGIDIHPGARIGEYFSIDHGTGVVIGETCIIGNRVRLYQGVTLGAKSFKFDADGNPLNEPRHPVLEDGVVVYSNSSILGRVRIGHDSVIGGNVWVTSDLPPHSRVVQGRASVSSFSEGEGI